ncbi:MAG: hypothetical protein MAG795_00245 [Candidatus Woesearchaeota archaeon]|nr:hypothetical protein [Candidatus Woesearchaeota archaeon]
MLKKYIKKYYFQTLLVITLILIVILIFNINNLNNKIENQKKELENRNEQISNLNKDISNLNISFNQLKSEKQNLESEKQNLEINFEELDEEYSNLKDETNLLLSDINTYQEEIEESLEWYKINSLLDDNTEQKRVKRQIDNNCVEIRNNECKIKLGCFYLINSEKLDLEYKYDETIYEKEDKLTSIKDFLKNDGGDCEDYSLFFKAEYNYALNQCEDNNIVLEGWKYPNSEDRETKYWLNFQKSWYLDDVAKVEIKDNIYPNIICGNLYDPILGDVAGHCMIAYTQNEIKSINDLSELDNAYIIEPQDGSFQGNINRENSEVYLLNEDIWYDESVNSWIYSIITDNDYFLFSESDLDWNSYSLFNSHLNTKKNELLYLLN